MLDKIGELKIIQFFHFINRGIGVEVERRSRATVITIIRSTNTLTAATLTAPAASSGR